MQRMDERTDLHLQLIRQAAAHRFVAEQHFRAVLVSARAAGLPLASIAGATDLSVSRIHAILEEEKMQAHAVTALTNSAVATDDVLIVAARVAYPDYLRYNAYICQDGRSFREVMRLGFYRHGQIEPHFPAIRAIDDHVPFSDEHAKRLRATGSPVDREIANLIETAPRYYRKHEGEKHKVFLLTPPDDPQTLVLPQPIRHNRSGRGSAWTFGHGYASEAALLANPRSTDDL
jgi:hypothetical protein